MFSIQFGNNHPKLSHYIRALASPARNECSTKEVIVMQHQQNARKMYLIAPHLLENTTVSSISEGRLTNNSQIHEEVFGHKNLGINVDVQLKISYNPPPA